MLRQPLAADAIPPAASQGDAVPPQPRRSYAAAATTTAKQPVIPRVGKIHVFDKSANKKSYGVVTERNGIPHIQLSDKEIDELSKPFRFALIGKFSHGYPTMARLHELFMELELKGEFKLGVMNIKHVLIRLSCEKDYSKIWLRRIINFDGYPMRVLKWTPTFNPKIESSIAPVWIKLPSLKTQFFNPDILHDIVSQIGESLGYDEGTFDCNRPDYARACVELDLPKPLKTKLSIGFNGGTLIQSVIYERLPAYCRKCSRLGHDKKDCHDLVSHENQDDQPDLRQVIQDKREAAANFPTETSKEKGKQSDHRDNPIDIQKDSQTNKQTAQKDLIWREKTQQKEKSNLDIVEENNDTTEAPEQIQIIGKIHENPLVVHEDEEAENAGTISGSEDGGENGSEPEADPPDEDGDHPKDLKQLALYKPASSDDEGNDDFTLVAQKKRRGRPPKNPTMASKGTTSSLAIKQGLQ